MTTDQKCRNIVRSPLYAAAYIFFTPFFTTANTVERLILQRGKYFMILFSVYNSPNVVCANYKQRPICCKQMHVVAYLKNA